MAAHRKKLTALILSSAFLFLLCACAPLAAAPTGDSLPTGDVLPENAALSSDGASAEHEFSSQAESLTENDSLAEAAAQPEDNRWFWAKRVVHGEEQEELQKCYTLEEVQALQEGSVSMYLQLMCEYQGYTLAEDAQTPCTHNFYQSHGSEGFVPKDAQSHFYYSINAVICEECKIIISAKPGFIHEEPHEFPPYEETDPHWGKPDGIFYTTYPEGCYCSYPMSLAQGDQS